MTNWRCERNMLLLFDLPKLGLPFQIMLNGIKKILYWIGDDAFIIHQWGLLKIIIVIIIWGINWQIAETQQCVTVSQQLFGADNSKIAISTDWLCISAQFSFGNSIFFSPIYLINSLTQLFEVKIMDSGN